MRKALIVDDNEKNLYLLKAVLEGHKFEVVGAHNGSEAMERAMESAPDIVISDILMPVMDGFALCAKWTRDDRLSRIPFVFYSATYTDPADEALALSLGAARFILKPTEAGVFVAILEDVLRQFEKGGLGNVKPPDLKADERDQYRLYSEALIRKLESKMLELEATRSTLEEEIQERRRAEEELRLHAQVFEQAHEGILIADASEKILTVNRAFCALTGYREIDLIGQKPYMMSPGPHDVSFFDTIRSSLTDDGRWQGEIWIRNKAGEQQPMWVTVASLRNANGNISSFLAMILDISEQKTQAARIEKLAFFDPITGLPNRALLLDRLEQVLAGSARRTESASIFFLNLDRFREINEAQGHAMGDFVLQEVTRRFIGSLPPDALLARFGGDEFVAVKERTDQNAADFTAARLAESLRAPIFVGEHPIQVGTSVGISIFPTDGRSADELLRNAGIAMHRAKAAGRSHLFFRSDMSLQIARRIQMASRLSAALASGQLELYFQPQFALDTGKLVGAEALARWHDNEWGWVSPAEFIPLAESRGLIGALGNWVLREACRHVSTWRGNGFPSPPRISINVSAYQLRDANLVDAFTEICRREGQSPGAFEIELTESSAMEDPENASQVLHSLKEAGFTLAIDDFGVAYSSLIYLKRFEADKLKIDMSFVRGMVESANDRAIVATIIGMARGLGMRTLAEGVEEPAQETILKSLGCDDVQGYLYGKPQPAEVFAKTYSNGRHG